MKRLPAVVLAVTMAAAVPAAFSQEKEKEAQTHEGGGESGEGNLGVWKWANFVVLAAGIGYLIGKNAGPMFEARSKQIRKDIVESEAVREQAESRAAEVERRLASLEAEIAALRQEAGSEAEAETKRLEQYTAAEIAKIQAHAEHEIATAAKAARMELKRYSAELALGLAERKIRDRMTPEAKDSLVRGFVRDLQ
jgi:F-type H+-transporting ATPase subunit b